MPVASGTSFAEGGGVATGARQGTLTKTSDDDCPRQSGSRSSILGKSMRFLVFLTGMQVHMLSRRTIACMERKKAFVHVGTSSMHTAT